MAATATSPIRIFDADHQPLRLLAEAQGLKPAEVFHAALLEYMSNHREALSEVFEKTREAVAAGDLDALTEITKRGAQPMIDETVDRYSKL